MIGRSCWRRFISRLRICTVVCVPLLVCNTRAALAQQSNTTVREINDPLSAEPDFVQSVVGATLIDGRGGPAVRNSVVVIRGNRITAVGARDTVAVPADATVIDATGLTLLPRFLDSHFHCGGGASMTRIPSIFLKRGVTSARDPGRPFATIDRSERCRLLFPDSFSLVHTSTKRRQRTLKMPS